MRAIITLCMAFCFCAFSVQAQTPSYYDLTLEADSTTNPYSPTSSDYAFVRSKRGVDGVNQTPEADAVRGSKISRIVLVFSEDSPEDLENREEYNQERWDNLILTYPEFFQEKTKYRNVCQCTANAGGETFKAAQGFYIYFKAPEKAAAVKEEKKTEPEKAPVQEKPKETPKPTAPEKVVGAAVTVVAATETPKEKKTEEKTPVKEPEPVAVEPVKQKEPETEPVKQVQKEAEVDPEEEPAEKPAKTAAKKPATGKPRRAKDPKACRPAFYGYGDQDLDAFFKDNIALSKKQKKAAKKLDAELRLQLNFDGSIKRVTLLCENKDLKDLIESAVKGMNNWNAAVRNGVAIKCEVRMKLRFDKSSKAIRAFDLMNAPKPNPKCKCVSDDEIFGS